MKNAELPLIGAAQAVFEPIRPFVEIDGSTTITLAQLKRQIDFIYERQRLLEKPASINQLFTRLQSDPIIFTAYGASYAAVILENDTGTLSPGRTKELERTRGNVRYERNSKVIISRRPDNNWRNNESAKIARLETAKVTIMPLAEWQNLAGDRQKQKLENENQQKNKRLALRFIGKNLQSVFGKSESPQKSNDWSTLARDRHILGKIPNNAILSMGFGMDTAIPIRLLSYPLLALELMRQKPGVTLEYYWATQFCSLFGISPFEAGNAENKASRMLLAFINHVYPDLSGRVQVLQSNPLTAEQISFIRGTLVPMLSVKRNFMEFANERNGEDSLSYMAAHALYMRDRLPIAPSLYINPLPQDKRPILMIGGDGEQTMLEVRQWIAYRLKAKTPTIIFTSLGRKPPYFHVENEPVIGQALSTGFLSSASPEVYRDYASVLVSIAKMIGDSAIGFGDISANTSRRTDFLALDSTQLALQYLNEFSINF